MPDNHKWRVGTKVGRTIYIDDQLVGMMDTPELARQVVDAVSMVDRLAEALRKALDSPVFSVMTDEEMDAFEAELHALVVEYDGLEKQ